MFKESIVFSHIVMSNTLMTKSMLCEDFKMVVLLHEHGLVT